MRIEPMGDTALFVRDLPAEAFRIADAIRALSLPGVLDVTSSYDTVGIYGVEPGQLDAAQIREAVKHLHLPDAAEGKLHEIPVCYDVGPDLQEVAERLRLTTNEVVSLHSSTKYTCYAMGFCPGFAYLGWLPEAISGVPRRPQPRVRVQPGSVAITGRQTAVYPLERPGGWTLIGQTPAVMVDEAADYFPIKAGDKVRFRAISRREFEAISERGARISDL